MIPQGAAIAEAYAKEHANLVLVARSEDELQQVGTQNQYLQPSEQSPA